jgi:folate-binding protein YgfZ
MINGMKITRDCYTPLPDLGLIQVTGPDAASFLQTQLTNEVLKQPESQAAWNGYCQPKGRLLASFLVWKNGETVYLSLARDLATATAKRLGLYVLRAKAKVTDVSASWRAFGCLEPLKSASLDQPPMRCESLTLAASEPGFSLTLPVASGAERRLIWTPETYAAQLEQELASRSEACAPNVWALSQIHAGIAHIEPATVEKFVPQMVNYELIGGVSFKKGCYPGQEVVARSQYLGKLKRRMFLGRIANTSTLIRAGVDVTSPGATEPVGMVVNAADNGLGGMDLLFETTLSAAHATLLVDGQHISLLPLPYELPSETATV